MKSKWFVSSNPIAGVMMYQAQRIKDTSAVDHSGNREYAGKLTDDEAAAMALAEKLNREQA